MNNYYSIEIKKVNQSISEIINNTKLPFSIIKLIIDNFSKEVNFYAEKEYNIDLESYQKDLKEANKKEEENPSEENN